jgi:hypothetical protein
MVSLLASVRVPALETKMGPSGLRRRGRVLQLLAGLNHTGPLGPTPLTCGQPSLSPAAGDSSGRMKCVDG